MDDNHIRVLLIEDNLGDARLIREMLAEARGAPFELECADRLSTGLERLAAGGIDVLLLDLLLPDSQGLDTVGRVRALAPEVPIVVFTVLGDETLAVQAIREGAQDYLIKGQMDGHLLVRAMRYAIERKRAEEALRESKHRLEEALAELKATQQHVLQQERLHALGQMARGIAHEFNNTLSPILGFSEILLSRPERLDDREKVMRHLQMINNAAKNAGTAVRRLREFYRPRERGEDFVPVNLNQLIEHAVMLTQPRWKDEALAIGITIRLETDTQDVPLIAGNEAELREVLINLIFNAADAMPEGGTITLRTRADGGYAILEVSDTGTGMTEEVRQRCLDPFFTTKGRQGAGLGLATVYGIIQRHQGTLAIESEQGRGTTVRIRLSAHRVQEAAGRASVTGAPSRPLHLLVVDDELPVREVVTEYLTGDGHTVETAANGREGLQKFWVGWFDVVVTDQAMPEMPGDQLAAAIKRAAPKKPVILLTGFGDVLKDSGERPTGVDFIVSKPVTLTALRQALVEVTAD
ncbi:MAG: response regulator [Candidatus Methylomirabilales bacterium]